MRTCCVSDLVLIQERELGSKLGVSGYMDTLYPTNNPYMKIGFLVSYFSILQTLKIDSEKFKSKVKATQNERKCMLFTLD